VFYVCLFDVTLHEDDLKEIETCRSISWLCVPVHFKYLCMLLPYMNLFMWGNPVFPWTCTTWTKWHDNRSSSQMRNVRRRANYLLIT